MRVPGLSAAAAGGCAGRRPRRVAAPLLPVLPLLPIEVLLPLPLLEVEAERLQLLVRGQHLLSNLVFQEICRVVRGRGSTTDGALANLFHFTRIEGSRRHLAVVKVGLDVLLVLLRHLLNLRALPEIENK